MLENEDNKESKPELPETLPLLVLEENVVFPGVVFPLSISDETTIKMINDALEGNKLVAAFTAKKSEDSEEGDFFHVGAVSVIIRMFRVPDGSIRLLMQGLLRVKYLETVSDKPYKNVRIEKLPLDRRRPRRVEALTRILTDEFKQVIEQAPYLSDDIKVALLNIKDPEILADLITSNLNIPPEEKQQVLEMTDLEQRLAKVSSLVSKELKLLKLSNKIRGEVDEELDKTQKQYYLREQLKAIKKELGEEDAYSEEVEGLEKRLLETPMPEKALEAAKKELSRLAMMSPASAEYSVVRTYLDWILELPWEISTKDTIDIKKAQKILDEDHYGLKDVKERILEYLAVRKLNESIKGPILCLAGPPGVGKTSLGKSIARATGRKFVRMSLGGMHDEAEIRGHRRTYIGALPGRIIQSIRNAGANNPIFMLDEIDKVGADFRGDPSSALLEVLDPEQNNTFQDHYLDLEFDLSKVMFITTANVVHSISPPLRDRMETITLPGYITLEKIEIARRYLVPRQIEENGLTRKQISFSTGALQRIISQYTREAGVRNLERTIARVCRKLAFKIAAGESEAENISVRNYTDYLGTPQFIGEITEHPPLVGVATGLAYTPVGGEVLLIESSMMPGSKSLQITGQLGDVMRESAEIALSYLRANSQKFGIKKDFFKNIDIHIHVPEGATPKDGPSAGVTMLTSLASLLSGRKVRNDVAMTGEITLRGRVLPIGGLREKVTAAVRSKIKEIILPEENRKDLKDIPEEVASKIKFHFVERIDQVLTAALLPPRKKRKTNDE
ncbi:MAG: endopeptidase La [FCB group bacterium]|nr:endopeptidase La [FCB group bacterium]